MGPLTKAWLVMMALIAVVGGAISIYLIEKGYALPGIAMLENGGALLGSMAFALGFVHMFKYMSES